jgi:hypothetical protein
MDKPPIMERAFELARSGSCRTLSDIRQRLAAEKYEGVDANLAGPSIRRQLYALMKAAQS